MERNEVSIGNTIITKTDNKGTSVSGLVLSKGTKNCSVKDAKGEIWTIPFSMIIACNDTVESVEVIKAKKGQIIVTVRGEKYKVDKVNSARYTATRLSDGVAMYIPFHSVVEVLDNVPSQREWLKNKGLTTKDIAEFESLFAH